MKRITSLIILILLPYLISAQVQTYVQKGIVRSQSFASKKGTGIVGAVIVRSGNNASSAISVDTPQDGYFELPMKNMDNSKTYYISSVKGPKGTHYQLLYPQYNDKLEFTPNAPLTIIMQSNRELEEYASNVKEQAVKMAKKRFKKERDRLELECQQGRISLIKKDSLITALQSKLDNYNEIIYDYIRKDLQEEDFERLDARQKEICIAMEAGNYVRLDSLLNWRSNEDRRSEFLKSQKELDLAKQLYETKDKKYKKVINNIKYEKDAMVYSALGQLDFEKALSEMKDRLFYDSINVRYLCQIGELLEIRYNDYRQALIYYKKALLNATKPKGYDAVIAAVCHNHLGDVYNSLSEYALAENHYTQARLLLESTKEELLQEVYDSYLGLGNVSYPQAKFEEALTFYKKCAAPAVVSINRKAFWQGKIGIGRIKLAKGDYHGAKVEFSTIVKEIVSKQDIDVVTLSMAYSSMIEYMTTIGQYQEAIDSCDAAIKIIKKHSSPKNTYIADLLINQGNAFINIGKIKDGEKCMKEAIEIYKNILGENHPNYASACVMFADYYNLVGDLRKSEEMSNKALVLLDTKFGKNHLTTVAAHFSLSQLYQTCAKYGKAQVELDTIRTIFNSAGLLNDYNRIQLDIREAALNMAQGKQSLGLKIYKEAIDCVTKTLGKSSVQLIGIYNQMAMTCLEQHENDKAKGYLETAQSLANMIYGVNNIAAIIQQMGMGQYYINRGDYHKAFELYAKIERAAVETFGADNYQLCAVYNILGDYHLGQYHFDRAKYYYDKLYEIVRNTYGENHYFIAEPITKMGAYYMQIGDSYKGLEEMQQAYSILSNHFEVGHKATLQSQLGICSAYIQLGQFDQAESILIELLKAVENKLGENHLMYSNVLQIKATLHQSKGEYNKGIKCIEKAIRITESIYGLHHSNTMQLYEQLSKTYSDMCNFHKAIEYNDITIAIATNFYGKDNVGVMPFLLGKGQLYANLNKFGDAHKVYDAVKSAYISHYGDSCIQMNSVLMSEAQLLVQEGYGEHALEILKSIETQMISVYGKNSILLCGVFNSLANAYGGIMQFREARKYYQKSLDIVKNSLGEYNVNCIVPLVGLGNMCISEDVTGQQIVEATRLFLKASIISSSVYGSRNANTASIDAILGQISLRKGNLQDAYNKFQKYSASVMQTVGESSHSRVADVHINMGHYYIAKANEASFRQDSINAHSYALLAMKEYIKAKEVAEEIYGSNNAGIANILNYIAQVHYMLQQPDSAITTYIKAAELAIRQYGKQSPLVAQAYATLGAAYKYESDQVHLGNEKKLNDAKECFLKAIAIRENSNGSSKEILIASTMDWRFTLSSIYMKQNDYNNAFRIIDKIINELENLQLGNKFGLYNCYYTKASMIVESEGNAEDALEFLVKARNTFSQLTFPNNLMKEMQQFQLLFAFGNVYEKMGMHNEAVENFEKAYDKLRFFPNNSQVELMKKGMKDKIQELKDK